ncbi:MAG: ribbon-helix-helix protein, CopG family [Solirubrobacteraceae bacterium]
MVKTTVYLDEDQAHALRRLAAATGCSQAEIIRAAITEATRDLPTRRLGFVGAGRGGGAAVAEHADALARKEMGQRRR